MMELKQLEFFMAASNYGSLSKAAAKLYTTQPNVSKVIRALETELGQPLFERTSRGLRLTPYGKSIYEYADNVIKNARLITDSQLPEETEQIFRISTYSSNMIVGLLVDLYRQHSHLIIEHHQGTVEEITNQVAQGISELGILYVSQKQLKAFRHIISHKKLEFTELAKKEACIYIGPGSPFYSREFVTLNELSQVRYVRGLSDYFSMEHHLQQINVGAISSEILHPTVYTNSEHLKTSMLMYTDVAELGINFTHPQHQKYDIKHLRIEGEEAYLTMGYVTEKNQALSQLGKELVEQLNQVLKS